MLNKKESELDEFENSHHIKRAKDAKVQTSLLKSWLREKSQEWRLYKLLLKLQKKKKKKTHKVRALVHTKGLLKRLRVCLIDHLNQTTGPPGGLRALTLIYHSRKPRQIKD